MGEEKEKHQLCNLYHHKSDIDLFEEYLFNTITSKNKDINNLIQYVGNSSINLDKKIASISAKEVASDLANPLIKTNLGFCSEKITRIEPIDILKTLRLADVAQNFILQSELKITSIFQDGYANKYINTKLGAYAPLIGKDPTEAFTNIMNKKGMPDIYHLYKTGVIDIDDILICRNSSDGAIFRNWLKSEDYDESSVLKALINKKNQSNVNKFVRYLYPTILGLVTPLAGAASSAFDSYIMNRVTEGWSPSLFLDNVLKENIDNKIKLYERKKKHEQFIKRFGSIGRNDKCPCQSGKKYKKCHGQ